MRQTKMLIIFLILVSTISVCFGQEIAEDENWLKGLGTEADYLPSLTYPFTKFTKEHLTKGKERLRTLRRFVPKNEWEGTYYINTGLGNSKLIWNSEGGFFDFFFYHYLKSFDYGTVADSPSLVVLVSEKPLISTSRKKQSAKSKLIKVKIGEKHFLVPRDRLQDFCNRAAGLSTDPDDFYYYWVKESDMEKDDSGLPVLPPEYKHFLRYPIESKIIQLRGRIVKINKNSPPSEEIHYFVTLDAGKNKNVKKDMNFFVEDLGEWVQITKVSSKSSTGFIKRDFGENNQEQCWDSEGGSGNTVPCKEIKIGMKAKTKNTGF